MNCSLLWVYIYTYIYLFCGQNRCFLPCDGIKDIINRHADKHLIINLGKSNERKLECAKAPYPNLEWWSGKASEQVILVLGAVVWIEVNHVNGKGKNIPDRSHRMWDDSWDVFHALKGQCGWSTQAQGVWHAHDPGEAGQASLFITVWVSPTLSRCWKTIQSTISMQQYHGVAECGW